MQAVGCAEVGRYFAAHPEAARKATGDYRQFKEVKFHGDEITYVSLGDGTSSEGEFWEALNTAANSRLPLIFVVEDNELCHFRSGRGADRRVETFPAW